MGCVLQVITLPSPDNMRLDTLNDLAQRAASGVAPHRSHNMRGRQFPYLQTLTQDIATAPWESAISGPGDQAIVCSGLRTPIGTHVKKIYSMVSSRVILQFTDYKKYNYELFDENSFVEKYHGYQTNFNRDILMLALLRLPVAVVQNFSKYMRLLFFLAYYKVRALFQ